MALTLTVAIAGDDEEAGRLEAIRKVHLIGETGSDCNVNSRDAVLVLVSIVICR